MISRIPAFARPRLPIIAAIIALGVLVWLAPAGRWDLWGPDEGRYTLIARELLRGENPFFLTVNGEPYPDKPFLPFWMIAAALAPSGGEVNEQFARAPAALVAILTLLMTFWIGARRWGPRAGAMAAAMLFTSYLFTAEAVAVRLDMPLTFWVTLGVFALALGRRADTGRLTPAAALTFWLAMGGAMLTKGPVALLFPLGWLAGEAWAARTVRPLWRIALAPGLLFLGGLTGWWIWMQSRMHPPEFVAEQTVGQILPRIFHPEGHVEAPWYFLREIFFSSFLPWSPFLAAALVHLWRVRRSGTLRQTPALAATLGWIAVPFIILSIIPSKREQYFMPSAPALALLTGWYVSEVIWRRAVARFVRWPLGAVFAIAAITLTGLGILYGMEKSVLAEQGLMLGKNEGYALIAFGAAMFIPAALLALARSWGRFAVALGILAAMACGFQTWFLNPAINNHKSARAFNLYLARMARPIGGVVGAFDGSDKAENQVYTTVRFQHVDYKAIAKSGGIGIENLPPVMFGKDSHWDQYGDVFRQAGYRLVSDYFREPEEYSVFVDEDRYTSTAALLADAHINAGKPMRFLFFGDSGKPNQSLSNLISGAVERHRHNSTEAVFLLGDNAYLWYPPARLMDVVFVEPFLPLLRDGVPFHAIIGNHDDDNGLMDYQIRFPLLGLDGRDYYTVNYGHGLVEYFCVDYTTLDNEAASEQRIWLSESLHSSRARWKIVLIHKPPYATEYKHGSSLDMQRLLEDAGWREAGVDAVFSGHNHWYERRGDVEDVLLIVNGGASKPERTNLPAKDDPNRLAYESRRATALLVDITPHSLRFEAFTEDGDIVDEGEVFK